MCLLSGMVPARRWAAAGWWFVPALLGGGVYVVVCVALVWAFLPDGGLREFWNTTIGFQLQRTSPLSIWGRVPSLGSLRPIFTALALILILFNRRASLDVTLWQEIREPGPPQTIDRPEEAEPVEPEPGPESYPVLTPSGIEPAHPVEPWLERRK